MNGWICIDASLALLWLGPGSQIESARRLRRWCNQEEIGMVAPPLFRPEVTSTIRRWLHTGAIDHEFARQAVHRSLRLRIEIVHEFDALQMRAFDIATQLNQPRAYDAQYLALAEFRQCDFWTADERFANAARREFSNVRFIGEFA